MLHLLTLQIYRVLGIRIILTNTVTFTSGDRFTVVSAPTPLLNAFTSYVRAELQNTVHYDSIMLIT